MFGRLAAALAAGTEAVSNAKDSRRMNLSMGASVRGKADGFNRQAPPKAGQAVEGELPVTCADKAIPAVRPFVIVGSMIAIR